MKLLCFGDSNTYGYDPRGIFADRYDEPWCELLARETGWDVINCGSNGRALPGSVRWLDSYLNNYAGVDKVIIMMGSNDILQGRSTGRITQDMEALLVQLQTARPDVSIALLSPPPITLWEENFDSRLNEVAESYKGLAAKLNIPFADTRDWGLPMAFDGVHLSEAGHRVFAEKMLNELKIGG